MLCNLGKLLNLLEPVSLSYNEENSINQRIQLMHVRPPAQCLIKIVSTVIIVPPPFPSFWITDTNVMRFLNLWKVYGGPWRLQNGCWSEGRLENAGWAENVSA